MHNRKFIVFVLLCAVMLLGLPCCSSIPVRHAQQTVAVADSLRVNEGATCDDSLALAEAYSTLGHWRLIYPDDYARACYYYGRMLRQHNNQVAAMQAFISGSHAPYVQRIVPLPWFSDYHILGRIYSNMGTMCHQADEFELSYAMYENAAKQIIKTNDSISYYYLLNDMAVELSEQNLHDQTLLLLNEIEKNCSNSDVLTKTWETKARLYKNISLYDSAIYAAQKLYECGYYAASGHVTMAQSYWYLKQYDSAQYYAQCVMEHPHATDKDKYNMLYILLSNDSKISKEEIHHYSEERSDIDKEILDPLHLQLQQAIDTLLHDMNNRPHYFNLGLLLVSLLLIGGATWASKKKISQNTQKLKEEVVLNKKIHSEEILQNIEYTCALWRKQGKELRKTLDMDNYQNFSATVNAHCYGLVDKLNNLAKLSQTETKLCVLVFIGLNSEQIQQMLPYSAKGYGKLKYTSSRKIGTTAKEMRDYMLKLLIL